MMEMILLMKYLSCHFKQYKMKKNYPLLSIFILLTMLVSCSKDGGTYNRDYLQPGSATNNSYSQVSFWAEDWYGGGTDNYIFVPAGILTISIGGQTNTLYYYLNSPGPSSCGAFGTVNFSLRPGTYSWKGWNSIRTDTLRRTLTIPPGSPCVFVRL